MVKGTVNPNTGLREYKGLKNILKIALPIALTFVAGPMGTALGTSLTAGTALASYAPVIGGALVGAGSSALQGLVSGQGLDLKNIGLGAVSGGIGGLAPGITDSLAQQFPNLSEGAIRAIAGGTAGALGSAVTGSDFGEGIVRGAIGQLAMPAVQDMTKRASEALFGGVQAAATPTGVGGGTMKPTPVSKTDIVFEEGQFGGKTPFKSAVLDSVQEMPIPTDESIFASQFVEGPTSQTDLPALDQALIRTGLYDKATIAEDFTNIPKLATEPKMPVDVGSNVDPYNTDAQLANKPRNVK